MVIQHSREREYVRKWRCHVCFVNVSLALCAIETSHVFPDPPGEPNVNKLERRDEDIRPADNDQKDHAKWEEYQIPSSAQTIGSVKQVHVPG